MDASPTSLFDSYEQDYKQLIEAIRAKLDDGDASSSENAGKQFCPSGHPPRPLTRTQSSERQPCAAQISSWMRPTRW